MYNTLKNWADTYNPLERSEELHLIASSKDDVDLFETLLKHNARLIIYELNKWQSTYNLDDAASLVVYKLQRTFKNWNRTDISFYHFARLRIKSALHESIRVHSNGNLESLEDYAETLESPEKTEFNDLLETCKEILTTSEYNMIYNIYFLGETIKDSTNLASSSRKHHKILMKLKKFLEND